jgi:uncharacterized protein (TIGR02302 family)
MSDRFRLFSRPFKHLGGQSRPDTPRGRLERLVERARYALWIENLWPRLWLPLGVVGAFLILSWLGLWQEIAPIWRMVGSIVFGLLFVASLIPLAFARRPARNLALDRLDHDSGIRHGPARTLDDELAVGSTDAGAMVLWELHRRRAEASIARLKVNPPRPDMPRRDRFAFRAAGILALVASAFVAGPDLANRLTSAFEWRAPTPAPPAFRVDGWIDPPVYTRIPPLMIDLAAGVQQLRAPVNSTVVVRMAGTGEISLDPRGGLEAEPVAERAEGQTLREERFTLTSDAELDLRTDSGQALSLVIQAIPDDPPTVAFTAPLEVQARGQYNLNYRADDDYGIASTRGVISLPPAAEGQRTLVPAPEMPLASPGPGQQSDMQANLDHSEHPWAGARVQLQLEARDEAGQFGFSEVRDFTLPQRPFTKPLARALVEQRRNLVLDPDRADRVQVALDALLIEPAVYTPQWGVFLGLRSASTRLRNATTDDHLIEVAEWLWTMALQIEDGDLSDAERALRAAQERLQEAMDRDAPDEELRQLMDELRAAMDNFLREFAEQMMREQQAQDQDGNPIPQENQRTITQNDLNEMMDRMQEAMRRGDMAEAQRLMDELRNIMQNLQQARPDNRMTDPMAREMQRQMNELDELTRQQQQLRDDTFQEEQDRRMGRDRRPEGQQGEDGEGGEQGLSERQQALRDQLRDLQERMRDLGMQGEEGLSDAEGAMGDAEGALGEGQNDEAVDAQGRALEGLQRGMQGMAQQMQEMMGDGEGQGQGQAGDMPGQGQPGQRGSSDARDNDPLGRPTRNRDYSDGNVRVPTADESAAQRARRIMEELRQKLGDPARPREELEYFERLLRQN